MSFLDPTCHGQGQLQSQAYVTRFMSLVSSVFIQIYG